MLILKNELCLPFPKVNISDCNRESYLTSMLSLKNEELKKCGIEMVNFHYDIMIPNPELSVMLQVVDDTNSSYQRRNNIMSDVIKYVGISFGEVKKGIYCFYLLFAKFHEL